MKRQIKNLLVGLLCVLAPLTAYAEGELPLSGGGSMGMAPKAAFSGMAPMVAPVQSVPVGLPMASPGQGGQQVGQSPTMISPKGGEVGSNQLQQPASMQTLPAGQQPTTVPQTPQSMATQPQLTVSETVPERSVIEQTLFDTPDGSQMAKSQPTKLQPVQQFGYDFFKADARGFAPITDVPVGGEYILGTGDRINLIIWGSVDATFELEINQNGDVVIPKVGKVHLSGVPYGQLKAVLKSQIGQYLKDFQLSVTMGRLRLVKVFVVGQVKNPGDYSIPGMSTVLNGLIAAGGPTKNGSLRTIQVKRDGNVIERIDLYNFFLRGDKSKDIRLMPGDTIYVPSIGPVAGIAGTVRRPGIYELKGESSLSDLLALSDGLVPTGYLQRIQISRVDAHDKKTVTDISLDPKKNGKDIQAITAAVTIKDLDLVKIFPISSTLRGYVRLDGYVLRPGDYATQQGMKVSTLLEKDNVLPEYYPDAAQLVRMSPPEYRPEVVYVNIKKALSHDAAHDIELREFDTLKVFSRWEMEEMPQVRISGEVQKPGTYRMLDGMRVRDLLVFAGNVKQTAYMPSAELSRTVLNGQSITSYPITINLTKALSGDPQNNIVLTKFDELHVRLIPNWSSEMDRYITLKGEVLFPGTYPVYRGEKLSSVIKRAGGYTRLAYLPAAKFTRRSVQEQQQKRLDEAVLRAEKDLTQKQAAIASTAASKEELESTKATVEALSKSLEQMKRLKAEGRVVLKLDDGAAFENGNYDLPLEGGETLDIPQKPAVVHVLGNVYNQTSFVYLKDSSSAGTYLAKAGGPTADAETSEMYVVRADGTVDSTQNRPFWHLGGFSSVEVGPGDTIVVPQKIERTAWMRDLKDMTQILANVALTAGSVYVWFK